MLAMIAMSAVIPFLPMFIRELGITRDVEERQWSGLVFAAPIGKDRKRRRKKL